MAAYRFHDLWMITACSWTICVRFSSSGSCTHRRRNNFVLPTCHSVVGTLSGPIIDLGENKSRLERVERRETRRLLDCLLGVQLQPHGVSPWGQQARVALHKVAKRHVHRKTLPSDFDDFQHSEVLELVQHKLVVVQG